MGILAKGPSGFQEELVQIRCLESPSHLDGFSVAIQHSRPCLGELPPELKCHFSSHFGYISVMSQGFYLRRGVEASFLLASVRTVPSRDPSQPASLWSTAQKALPLRAVVSGVGFFSLDAPFLAVVLCPGLFSHPTCFSLSFLSPHPPQPTSQWERDEGSMPSLLYQSESRLEERNRSLL